MFGAYLVDQGNQSSTLASYFSAIKSVLKVDGYPWADDKVALGALIRGCKYKNDRVKTRMPIGKKLLEAILFEVERVYGGEENPQPYLEILYKAVFSTAYYGLMRIGEIAMGNHTAKAKDVYIGQNKDKLLIMLYSSKTHDKESIPQKIKISALQPSADSGTVRFFCPFKLMRRYYNARGSYIYDEEPFFVFSDHSPIPPANLRKTLRFILQDRLNLDASLYDFHSFRSGRTTHMFKMGYTIQQIQIAGRWKSNAVYKYLKL